jgi:hypothetical protein
MEDRSEEKMLRDKNQCQRCLGSVGSLLRKKDRKQMSEQKCKAFVSVWKRRGRRINVKWKIGQKKGCFLHNRSTGWQIERLPQTLEAASRCQADSGRSSTGRFEAWSM